MCTFLYINISATTVLMPTWSYSFWLSMANLKPCTSAKTNTTTFTCFLFFYWNERQRGGKREPEKVSWRPETSGEASVSLKVLSAAASHKLRYLWLLQNKYTGAKESLTNAPLNYTLPVVRWELWALQEVVLRLLYCFWGLVSGFTKCCMTFVPSRVNMALLTKWVSKP